MMVGMVIMVMEGLTSVIETIYRNEGCSRQVHEVQEGLEVLPLL